MNEHVGFLFRTLWDFQQKDIQCDVTLEVGDEKVRAHKLILIASSDFFYKTLCSVHDKINITTIKCKGVKTGIMPLLVQYMYTGCITVNSSNVQHIIDAAEALQLHRLVHLGERLVSYNHVGSGHQDAQYKFPDGYTCTLKDWKEGTQSGRRRKSDTQDGKVRKKLKRVQTEANIRYRTSSATSQIAESNTRDRTSGAVPQTLESNTRDRTSGAVPQTLESNTRDRTSGAVPQTLESNTRDRTSGAVPQTLESNTRDQTCGAIPYIAESHSRRTTHGAKSKSPHQRQKPGSSKGSNFVSATQNKWKLYQPLLPNTGFFTKHCLKGLS